MIGIFIKFLIGKYLEVSVRGLMRCIIPDLPGGTEEDEE
jgi:hypothetical protein